MGYHAALGSTRILAADEESQRELVFELRRRVFVEEQGVPLEDELDGKDDEADQFLLFTAVGLAPQVSATQAPLELKISGGIEYAVACARVRWLNESDTPLSIKLERVAVLPAYRRLGLATQLVQQLLLRYQAQGSGAPRLVVIHAQLDAVVFWQKLGFGAVSQRFIEAGIWHLEMQRRC